MILMVIRLKRKTVSEDREKREASTTHHGILLSAIIIYRKQEDIA
jgi:hypothetical protein